MLKSRETAETFATKEHISDLKASLTPHRYNTLCAPASASTSVSNPSCVLREWPGTSRATALQLIAALGYCEGGTVSTCLDQAKPENPWKKPSTNRPRRVTHNTLRVPASISASACTSSCVCHSGPEFAKHMPTRARKICLERHCPTNRTYFQAKPPTPLQLPLLPVSWQSGPMDRLAADRKQLGPEFSFGGLCCRMSSQTNLGNRQQATQAFFFLHFLLSASWEHDPGLPKAKAKEHRAILSCREAYS